MSSNEKSGYALPASIVIAGALIGLGLFLGLQRAAPPYVAPSTAPTPTATTSAGVAVLTPTPATPPGTQPANPTIRPELMREIEAAAKKALEVEKTKVFVPKCWAPAVAAKPDPARSIYTVTMSFDATGLEIARGVAELRGEPSRPDVARCIRELPIGLRIDSKGAAVGSLELTLRFP